MSDWVTVKPDSIARVCDRLHDDNAPSGHKTGFCMACADIRVVLNVITAAELRAIADEYPDRA